MKVTRRELFKRFGLAALAAPAAVLLPQITMGEDDVPTDMIYDIGPTDVPSLSSLGMDRYESDFGPVYVKRQSVK